MVRLEVHLSQRVNIIVIIFRIPSAMKMFVLLSRNNIFEHLISKFQLVKQTAQRCFNFHCISWLRAGWISFVPRSFLGKSSGKAAIPVLDFMDARRKLRGLVCTDWNSRKVERFSNSAVLCDAEIVRHLLQPAIAPPPPSTPSFSPSVFTSTVERPLFAGATRVSIVRQELSDSLDGGWIHVQGGTVNIVEDNHSITKDLETSFVFSVIVPVEFAFVRFII